MHIVKKINKNPNPGSPAPCTLCYKKINRKTDYTYIGVHNKCGKEQSRRLKLKLCVSCGKSIKNKSKLLPRSKIHISCFESGMRVGYDKL